MRNDNYKLTQYSIQSIMGFVESSQIAIPQLQRPFVWKGKQVKDLVDSLYEGYPIGYLIVWRNSNVRLKDGGNASGKKILIDGQQRITALMAALMGKEILDEKYSKKRIQIAFNPFATEEEERFAVYSPKLDADVRWIPDISVVFKKGFAYRTFEAAYCERNPKADKKQLDKAISQLKEIANNEVGVVELSFLLDIDVVTEIFIRINSQGKPLNQEDFAMSRISVNEELGGDLLQKAVDHFCRLSLCPEDADDLLKADKSFTNSEFGQAVAWLKNTKQNLYIPNYSDVLKTAFSYKFGKVKVGDLVNMLSGKNPETKEITPEFANETFLKLKEGIMAYMKQENFEGFLQMIVDAGFINDRMAGSKNLLNGTYCMYLLMKEEGLSGAELSSYAMKWYVMSTLTGRYQTSYENAISRDFRETKEKGIRVYLEELERTILDESFWKEALPEKLKTTVIKSSYYSAYLAAMIRNQEYSLFSREKTMKNLVEEQVENSQIFPKVYLEKNGITAKELCGQVANCIYMDKSVKTFLKRKPPVDYLKDMLHQEEEEVKVGKELFTKEEILTSVHDNAIPVHAGEMTVADFEEFLYLRRKAMAEKICNYYKGL